MTGLPIVVLADSDTGKGSPIGLFVVLLLIVAVYFLYRSMSGHLRRLPDRFPGQGRAAGTGAEATPAEATPAAGAGAEPTPAEQPRAGTPQDELPQDELPPAEPPKFGPSGR